MDRLNSLLASPASGWLLAPALVVALQQVVWPAPAGAVLQGVVLGLLTSMVGLGIVLIYRSNRVLNFAQGELGLLPTILAVMLLIESGFPYFAVGGIGLAAALAIGVVVEFLVIRRFAKSPRLILTVATLGLAQLLGLAALLIPRWWDARVSSQRIDSPFDITFDLGSFRFNDNHVMVLVVVPIVLFAVWSLLRFTKVGIGIRAASELPDRASTLGMPVKGLQSIVWAIATALAFIALFLRAGVIGLPVGGALGLLFFLRALAAAVVARLTDIPAVLTTSVALGVLQSGIIWNAGSPLEADALMAAVTAGLILFALLARPRTFSRVEAARAALSMGETRPVPPELRDRVEVRAAIAVLWVAAIALALAVPYIFGPVNTLRIAFLYLFTITLLSLVLLTGWAGQISLGQLALSGFGSAFGGWMILHWNADLLVVVPVAGLLCAAIAVVVGLPALRLQGLYLAVTTFAFAVAASSYFLNTRFFDWLPDDRIPRLPILGRVDYSSTRGMYFVSLIALALALVALNGLRNSRTGRVLLALRDNEAGVAAFGVSVTRAKLTAFALSGFFAGCSGVLVVVHQQAYNGDGVSASGGIATLIAAVVGGLGSGFGALLGSLFFNGTFWWLKGIWRLFATGIGVLAVLLVAPGGLGAIIYQFRDWLLRRLALRHGIHVPSLVADSELSDAVASVPSDPLVLAIDDGGDVEAEVGSGAT